MPLATLDDLAEEIASYGSRSPEYVQKMLHAIPRAPVVDREQFILERCKGKSVVNFGCASGKLHGLITKVAVSVYGVDKVGPTDMLIDLDDPPNLSLESLPAAEVYVCGEILEHLANPGYFLGQLRDAMNRSPASVLIITVPNAFSSVARDHLRKGRENINIDHVCWYSWRSLRTLIERFGFTVVEFCWYTGHPLFAEGLIFVVK